MSEKTKRDTTTTTKKAHKEFTRYTNTHALCSNTFNVNKNSPSASLLSSSTARSPAIVGLLIEQTYDKIIINKRQQQLHRTVCFDFVLLFLSHSPLRSINKLKWAYSFVLLYFFLQLFSVSVSVSLTFHLLVENLFDAWNGEEAAAAATKLSSVVCFSSLSFFWVLSRSYRKMEFKFDSIELENFECRLNYTQIHTERESEVYVKCATCLSYSERHHVYN